MANREILFRGKVEDENRWIYGTVVYPRNIANEVYAGIIPILDGESEFNKIRRVDPSTIGQYTGLTDKNGKKIFEGDIISIPFEEDRSPYERNCTYYENGKVYFDTARYGWYVAFFDDELSLWEYDDCEVTVIGNIHDNPELMEVFP